MLRIAGVVGVVAAVAAAEAKPRTPSSRTQNEMPGLKGSGILFEHLNGKNEAESAYFDTALVGSLRDHFEPLDILG